MSASEAETAAPTLRLETFGTLALRGAAGYATSADHGHQGRRLALLAVLAASGERGFSRDQLLLLFWPESSQQRARHSLEQSLYEIRKWVDSSVFVGVNPLRLNPAVITSDVADFEEALRQERLEAAVELYHGPFLEGFYLSNAPEFEQWLDAQRSRLEAKYVDALERLAQSADSAGDHASAVRWWRMLSDADSVSTRNALGLMRALAAAGDHAAALRHAERHESTLAQELGTSVGPEIASLASEIRARVKVEPSRPVRLAPTSGLTEKVAEPRVSVIPARTTEGFVAQPEVATARRRRPRSRRTVGYGVMALALAVGVFAATRLRRELVETPAAATGPLPSSAEPSIAVLPLANLSADPQDAALADGMTEELIAILSRRDDLRVIASTSVFAFRGRATDVRSIADSLGVSNVLEGGIQKVGSHLRVQVRLVDARDGSTRWSETYDREFQDVFSMQEDIARAVARALDLQLAGGDDTQVSRRQIPNIAAYELYLRGHDPALTRSDSGVREAIGYFRQAIQIDSTYAAAYAGLATAYVRLGYAPDDPGMTLRELRARALEAAVKAVALDDSLAEGHNALGRVREAELDFLSAETEVKRAVALDPTRSPFRLNLSTLYIWAGRPADALTEARRALDNDPLSPYAHAQVAHALFVDRRYDEALAQLERISALRPPLRRTAVIAGQCYAKKEMWSEAIAALRPQAQYDEPVALSYLGHTLARAGQRAEANQILADLLARQQRTGSGAFEVAVVHTGLRDFDQAFAWLDKSVDDRSIKGDIRGPTFEELQSDPRYELLMRRLGL